MSPCQTSTLDVTESNTQLIYKFGDSQKISNTLRFSSSPDCLRGVSQQIRDPSSVPDFAEIDFSDGIVVKVPGDSHGPITDLEKIGTYTIQIDGEVNGEP